MASNFMGHRIGTVMGQPFLANRMKQPMFPSVPAMDPNSRHFRFLLSGPYGHFLSPFVRSVQARVVTGRTAATPENFKILTLQCDPFIPEHTFHLNGCIVIDYMNLELGRPVDFKLPYEVFAGEEITFKWSVLSR